MTGVGGFSWHWESLDGSGLVVLLVWIGMEVPGGGAAGAVDRHGCTVLKVVCAAPCVPAMTLALPVCTGVWYPSPWTQPQDWICFHVDDAWRTACPKRASRSVWRSEIPRYPETRWIASQACGIGGQDSKEPDDRNGIIKDSYYVRMLVEGSDVHSATSAPSRPIAAGAKRSSLSISLGHAH